MSDGKILVVEDDEDLVHMLEYNLTRKGYATMTALDGLDACYLIEEEKPDLILLDVMLPGLSGFEICEIIRNHYHEEISDIPIIMLTALGSMENKLKGIETGADDYIPKPFTLKEVLLKVDRLVCKEKKKKQMNMKVENLEAREKQQTDFQSMLFHELRNQLLIIGGYSSIAQRHELTPEKHRHYAGVIKESSSFLNSLAEEIILLSRVETGEYPLPREEVCLEEITQQTISVLLQQATKKEIQIHFQRTGKIPRMRLNPTAVKLCLSNLIENAVKYSPEKSGIRVSLMLQGEKEVIVEVKDSGPGIPEKDIGKIFNKFYRGENVKNKTKGTGIGLYIAKTLIEAMGGIISVESKDGNGTYFRVVLTDLHEIHD
ncbi:MAG: response regulator [Deltaproteobacteria bacterium]|nr:response regulator [Deltaproteobacteria bacterium]MBW2114859.1 response regulator [Deltaproteobacteria bacterium]